MLIKYSVTLIIDKYSISEFLEFKIAEKELTGKDLIHNFTSLRLRSFTQSIYCLYSTAKMYLFKIIPRLKVEIMNGNSYN